MKYGTRQERRINRTYTILPSVDKQLERLARKGGVSKSEMVNRLVQQTMEAKDNGQG